MDTHLKIKKLFSDAQIPTRKHPTDSGLDLYAYKIEQYPQDIQNNSDHAHYIIPRKPYKDHDVIHLVKDQDIAYHAGRSSPMWIKPKSGPFVLETDKEVTDCEKELMPEIYKNHPGAKLFSWEIVPNLKSKE